MDAQDGDKAKFDWDTNGKYKNVIKGTCVIKKGTGSAGAGGGSSNYAQKEKYWAEKEVRDIGTQQKISYAGALNTAVCMVNAMLERELLKLGGKKADAWDAFEAYVNDLAETLYVRIQSAPEYHEELMAGSSPPVQDTPEGLDDPEASEEEDEDEDW